MKIDAYLFNNFYSEFIYLALDLEYTSKILIWKFKYKLTPCFQDQLNFGVELFFLILALAKPSTSRYKL